MGARMAVALQDIVVKVAADQFEEGLLDEVERYAEWLDLAQELDHDETPWLVRLT